MSELSDRVAELAAIDNAVSNCRAGKPGVLLITGAAATGKSELASAFAARAAEEELLVLRASGLPDERDLAFGVIGQLVRGLRRGDRGGAAARLKSLIDEARASNVPHEQITIGHELAEGLIDLAVDGPVAALVDDVQHADAQSVHCLQFLVQRLQSVGLVLLVVECEQARPGVSSLSAVLLRHPRFCWLRLELLSRDGVGEVIAGELDTPAAERYLSGWFRLSGGNPLLVRALLQDHGPGRRAVQSGTYTLRGGHTFAAAVLSCVDRSDAVTCDVVNALAVLGERSSVALVAQMTDLDPRVVDDVVHALDGAGLTLQGRFRHDAVRTPVLGSIPANELVAIRHRAAQALHGIAAPATVVAEQLVAGGALVPWASPVLREAADCAVTEGRMRLALDCLELLLRQCHDEREAAMITAALADIERQIDPVAAARRLGTLVHAVHSGHLSGRDMMNTILELAAHGRRDEAMASLTSVPGEVLTITRMGLANSCPPVDHRPPAQQWPVPPTGSADPQALGVSALRTLLTGGSLESGVQMAELAMQRVRVGEFDQLTVTSALTTLLYADRLTEAALWCDLFLGQQSADLSPGYHTPLSGIRAEIAIRQGDIAGALEYIEGAADCLSGDAWGVVAGFQRGTAVLVNVELAQYAAAAKILEMPVPRGTFASRYGLHYLYARGRYHLAVNQVHAARGDFLQCGELAAALGMDVPGVVPWRTAAADVLVRLGKSDQARRLVEQLLSTQREQSKRVRGMAGRVMANIVEAGCGPALLHAAIDDLQAAGDRLELARACAELSRAYRRLGQTSCARPLVRRARQLAARCGAEALRRELNAGRPAGTVYGNNMSAHPMVAGILSEAEQRVAGLAAAGHTNREIAELLFITPSTVEQHLTKIYRKLNVSCREDLPSDLYADSA